MKQKNILIKIVDLLLTSDKTSADWDKVPKLRMCWHMVWLFIAVNMLINIGIGNTPLYNLLTNSSQATFVYRIIIAGFYLGMSFFFMVFTFFYYQHVISSKARIFLQNISFFYVGTIIFFGRTYYWIYLINQKLFIYQDPPVAVAPTITRASWGLQLNFILFSAFQTITGDFFRIRSASGWVSTLNYTQGVFTIILIALLVSSYVSKSMSRK